MEERGIADERGRLTGLAMTAADEGLLRVSKLVSSHLGAHTSGSSHRELMNRIYSFVM